VALDRAHTLVAEVETRYPGIWLALDALRAHPPTPWPEWCLLPMVGPASLPARLTVLSPTIGCNPGLVHNWWGCYSGGVRT